MKIFKTILIVVLALGTGVLAYYGYGYYTDYNSEVSKTSELESKVSELEKKLDDSEKDEEVVGCDHGLTDAEESIVSTWDTYTNSTYKYSFKYPSSWTLDASEPTKVDVSDTDSTFNVYSAEAAIMGFGGYTIVKEENIEIDCQTEKLISFSYDANGRIMVASFYNGSIQYTTMFSYEYVSASQSTNMEDLSILILKTMELN